MPHHERKKLGPNDPLPEALGGKPQFAADTEEAQELIQGSIFDKMRTAAKEVDVKTIIEEPKVPFEGISVEDILDPHYTEDRHKVTKRVCMSCLDWIKPGCCRMSADRAYAVVSYKITLWSDSCSKWRPIPKKTFPGGRPKGRKNWKPMQPKKTH